MSEKSHLLKQLAKIEQAEQAANQLLEYVKTNLCGKVIVRPCFFKRRAIVDAIHYTHYGDAVIERDTVVIEIRNVSFHTNKSKAKHTDSAVKVERGTETFYSHNSLPDFSKTTSLEVFESKWQFAAMKIDTATKTAVALEFPMGGQFYSDCADHDLKGDLDIPFVELPGGLRCWLEFSVFFIAGKYLITPNSLQFARKVIEEKEEIRRRCSHLYEECDRNFLEHEARQIADLRKLLKL